MVKRRAYEEIELSHSGNTLTLRPSLRAATVLEQRHGLPALHKALDDLNITIISEILTLTSRQDAAALLSAITATPLLPFFLSVRTPLTELVSMLTPASEPTAKRKAQTGKPVTWAEVYAALYDRATGWLGWTPEQAWNATPTEIERAYKAHLEKLKAIHRGGTGDKEPDPEQVERNVAAGLDPEFDRSGLHALKGLGGKR
jgi:hypothetical protein